MDTLLLLHPAWRQYLVWSLPFLAILAVTQVYAFQPFEADLLRLPHSQFVRRFPCRPGVSGQPLESCAPYTGRVRLIVGIPAYRPSPTSFRCVTSLPAMPMWRFDRDLHPNRYVGL